MKVTICQNDSIKTLNCKLCQSDSLVLSGTLIIKLSKNLFPLHTCKPNDYTPEI